MIIVSGTKRSGTSLWMQLLSNAGLPVIGERFPHDWGETIREANPNGFYESQLVHGVYYRTNPHPETGEYLRPEQVQRHAVKIFIPGLVRTDMAFIDRVLVTIRPWREVAASTEKLHAMVRPHAPFDPDALSHTRMPPALAWWSENFSMIRDAATRGYPIHVVSLQRLVAHPRESLAEALAWLDLELDGPKLDALVAMVDSGRASANATKNAQVDAHELEPADEQLFDELYDTMHRGVDFTASFVKTLNDTDKRLRPQILEHIGRARVEAARHLLAD